MNWKSGAMWAGMAGAAGLFLSFVLTSDQVAAVMTAGDQVKSVIAIAGATVAAFLAGVATKRPSE